jgi:outer membrane protein assembly factor BamE (lipoprotein component of BamABCDE complex)
MCVTRDLKAHDIDMPACVTCTFGRNLRLIAVACTLVMVGCGASPAASTVDAGSIRRVSIGMTQEQVRSLFGQPLRIRPWGASAVVYDYARGAPSSSGLWVYFEHDAVQTVQAKQRHWLASDTAVYEARADRTTFESPDFESTFDAR